MAEYIYEFQDISASEFSGVNGTNIKAIGSYFPKLKLVLRGNILKAIGDEEMLVNFEKKWDIIIHQYIKTNRIDPVKIGDIVTSDLGIESDVLKSNIIVYGHNGLVVKAHNSSQQKLVKSIFSNDMVFAIGPAGTGKTYTAVAMAVRALKNKEVAKIILTRPAVEAGENLGFLPGDLKEKLDPYLQPLYDGLRDMISPTKLKFYFENNQIQIAPLAFMRGRTLDKAFVILDEAQNATQAQLKMFLTRMGKSAKFVITGDLTQVDLPKSQVSGLMQAKKKLSNIKGIDFIELTGKDVMRHQLVREVIKAFA